MGGWANRAAKVLSWPLRHPFRVVSILTWPLRHPHQAVVTAEPWGIMLAVIGLFLSLFAFAFDYRDKVEERTVRAWQLVTTKAPGNSGKTDALEYLNSEGCFLGVCKKQTPLTGIDLSVKDDEVGVYLNSANLSDATLRSANLSRANLFEANFRGANLRGATLRGATLSLADISRAILSGADLGGANLGEANLKEVYLNGANLSGADLGGADLSLANLFTADLGGANLFMADLSGANLSKANLSKADLSETAGLRQAQLDEACGDDGEDGTQLDGGLSIPLCTEVEWFERFHSEYGQR